MSPNNPNDFIGSLVEMAKAYEQLPKYQAELTAAHADIESYAVQVQRLEMKLIDRANEIDELNARIRLAEVDRDHAETMFLEADDRTSRALDFIKATFGNAGSLIQALEPAKPISEPVKVEYDITFTPKSAEPEGLHTTSAVPLSGQSEPLPSSPAADAAGPQSVNELEPSANNTTTSPSPTPEVASAHPTVSSSSPPSYAPDAQCQPVESETSASPPSAADQSFSMPPQTKPYAGKTYSSAKNEQGAHFTWPDHDEWLSGGGTTDNFHA